MENKTSYMVAGFALAFSVVGTIYSANAVPQIAHKQSSAKLLEKLNIVNSCFGLEKTSTEKVCRISGEKLADYLGKKANIFFKSEGERKRFAELKSLMSKAHSLETSKGNSNNLAKEVMEFYKKKSKPLFDCRNLGNAKNRLFNDTLWEMVENPYGAKRLISLLMLRMIGENKKNNPFAYDFDNSIRIRTAASGESENAFNPRGFINLSLSKKPTNASILMHELTHFYHYLLFGMMSTTKIEGMEAIARMASDSGFRLTKTLFPTQDLDRAHTFGKFSDTIFNAIGNREINKGSLNKLLADLGNSRSTKVLSMAKGKYDNYCRKLTNAKTKSSLKEIAANLVAEYAFSSNYWTDQEEMLTIFGVAPVVMDRGRVVVIDRDNQSSFEKRSKTRVKIFHFTHKNEYFVRGVTALDNALKSLGIAKVYEKTVSDYQETTKEKVNAMFRNGYTCGNIMYTGRA